jgi:hypothetical protein
MPGGHILAGRPCGRRCPVIDRTDHDARIEAKHRRETIDDDAHADHSVDSDQAREDGSELPSVDELQDRAESG